MPEDFEDMQTADPAILRKWVPYLSQVPGGAVLPRKVSQQIANALYEQQKIIREMKRTARQRQLAFEAASQAKGWFVKDFADGWIFFRDEETAKRHAGDTGSTILVGIAPSHHPRNSASA